MSSILVTGGTGSFGQAFVRHLLDGQTHERICIYSRGEHSQAAMREMLRDNSRLRWFIGDVRDRDRLRRAVTGCDVVVHAAALKRIEVGHYNPIEMVKTNILGAINVVEAAIDAGATRVVGLSSDKAWQPISPYGFSKALAEAIFLAANNTTGTTGPTFVVTRYGNVAGSAGSVIPKWNGVFASNPDPALEMTDANCTRFYMTMQQAVELVCDAAFGALQAESLERPIVPEGLPAYRLIELGQAIAAKYGHGHPLFHVVGLPPWEKLHEGMRDGYTSDKARRLSVDELRSLLAEV